MKAATVVAVALAAFSSFPSPAQQEQQPVQQQQQQPVQQQQQQQTTQQVPPPATEQNPSAAQQNSPGTAPGQAQQTAAAQMQPVTAELMGKLDSKSAKQGDSVVVKTKEDVTFPGGAEIPKGSKLMGRVTNVQPRGDGKENSQIAIQFDRAELKGGQSVGIESIIQSISPAAGMGNADSGVPAAFGATPSSPGTPSGAMPAAPSMNGSSSPSMNGSNNTMNQINNRPGLASNTTAEPGTTNQNTNNGTPAPGSIVARNGNVAIRTTSIPGILLANNIDGVPFTNASGMLLGARRDIHLDGGTQMVVAIAAAPQAAGSGMSR